MTDKTAGILAKAAVLGATLFVWQVLSKKLKHNVERTLNSFDQLGNSALASAVCFSVGAACVLLAGDLAVETAMELYQRRIPAIKLPSTAASDTQSTPESIGAMHGIAGLMNSKWHASTGDRLAKMMRSKEGL